MTRTIDRALNVTTGWLVIACVALLGAPIGCGKDSSGLGPAVRGTADHDGAADSGDGPTGVDAPAGDVVSGKGGAAGNGALPGDAGDAATAGATGGAPGGSGGATGTPDAGGGPGSDGGSDGGTDGGPFICRAQQACMAGQDCQTVCAPTTAGQTGTSATVCLCAAANGGQALACATVPCEGGVADARPTTPVCPDGIRNGDDCDTRNDTICATSCTRQTQLRCVCAARVGSGGGPRWTCGATISCP